MAALREPAAWEFFRARGALWRAVSGPQDMGGQVGRAVRAGLVMWYEPRIDGQDAEVKLDTAQWVRCAEVEAVLDDDETMAAHLRDFLRKERPPAQVQARPDWLKLGAPAWARFGNQGWSPCIVLSINDEQGTAKVQFTKRKLREWTKDQVQKGSRPWDRLAPRDPARKGKDRPPVPSMSEPSERSQRLEG